MKYSEFIPYKIPFEDVDLDAYQDICHSYKVLARMKNIENTRIMVFDYISCGLSFYRDKDKAFIQQPDEAIHYIYHKEDLEQPGIKSSYRVWNKVLDMFSALPENEREFASFIHLFHGKVSEVNISYVIKAMPLLYTRKGKVAMIILSIQTSVIQSTQEHCFFYNRAQHKGMVYREDTDEWNEFSITPLTLEEQEIVLRSSTGESVKSIAGNMLRSVSTINERIRRLMRIYKVDNMRSLIAMMNLLQLV